MSERWIMRIFGFLLLVTIVLAGFGQATLQLWNWLMPSIFGLHAITYWQAVGLMGLCWILFGGLRGFGMIGGGRGHRGHWRRGMRERWEAMTPEQREQFLKGMGSRCAEPRPAAEPSA